MLVLNTGSPKIFRCEPKNAPRMAVPSSRTRMLSIRWTLSRFPVRLFFFFQAEDGIRDGSGDWSSDVCSSDLDVVAVDDLVKHWLPPSRGGLRQIGGDCFGDDRGRQERCAHAQVLRARVPR